MTTDKKAEMPWEVYTVGGMPERGVSFVNIPAEIGKWAVLPESEAKELWEMKCLIEDIKNNPVTDEPSLFGVSRSDVPKWSQLNSDVKRLRQLLLFVKDAMIEPAQRFLQIEGEDYYFEQLNNARLIIGNEITRMGRIHEAEARSLLAMKQENEKLRAKQKRLLDAASLTLEMIDDGRLRPSNFCYDSGQCDKLQKSFIEVLKK